MEFKSFENYVFDLYGTLIDVRHDEGDPEVWRKLSQWYAVYGADIEGEDLRGRYLDTIRREEERIGAALHCAFPEVDLMRIFLEIYDGAKLRKVSRAPSGDKERLAWATATANFFRIVTRYRLAVYEGARELLDALRAAGKRLFLLSNAQTVFTAPEIEVCGLDGYFEEMRLSSDYAVKKPNPAFFASLMRDRKMTAVDTVLIGNDLISDMGSALSCGSAGVYVNSYCKSEEDVSAVREAFVRRDGAGAGRFLDVRTIAELSAMIANN